jgi:ABC-type Na+ efflux pump permease subunit
LDYLTITLYWVLAIGSFLYGMNTKTVPWLFFVIAAGLSWIISTASMTITHTYPSGNSTVVATYGEPSMLYAAYAFLVISALFAWLYLFNDMAETMSIANKTRTMNQNARRPPYQRR